MGGWTVLLFATNQKYNQVFYIPRIWLWSLNNLVAWSADWYGVSLRNHKSSSSQHITFLCVADIREIMLMRWLHDPIVTKLCQNPWDGTLVHPLSILGRHINLDWEAFIIYRSWRSGEEIYEFFFSNVLQNFRDQDFILKFWSSSS